MSQRALVLDTQVFVNLHLNFDHPQFDQLLELNKNDSFQICIPKMVELEVRRKLSDRVRDLHNLLTKNRQLHKYFELEPVSVDQATKDALKDFENFKAKLSIKVLEHDSIGCNDLVHLYDNMLPPFSERKKNEFPDAISLLSIDKSVYEFKDIISADNDWQSYYEKNGSVELFKSLASYIDDKLREASDFVEALKQKLLSKENSKYLLDTIVERFMVTYPFSININHIPQKLTQRDCVNFRIKDLNITEIRKVYYKSKQGRVFAEDERCFIDLTLEFDVYIERERAEEMINGKVIEVSKLQQLTLSTSVWAYASLKNRSITSYSVGSFDDLEWYITS